MARKDPQFTPITGSLGGASFETQTREAFDAQRSDHSGVGIPPYLKDGDYWTETDINGNFIARWRWRSATPESKGEKVLSVVATDAQLETGTPEELDKLGITARQFVDLSKSIQNYKTLDDVIIRWEDDLVDSMFVKNGALLQNADTAYPEAYTLLTTTHANRTKTEAEWQALSNASANYGGVPYFVVDTTNKTIRLPDTRGMYLGASTSANSILKAGVPNITGSFSGGGGGTVGFNNLFTDGAFQLSTNTVTSLAGAAAPGNRVGFSATRSSAVYGRSTTVTPFTLTCLDCVYLGA